MIAKHIRVLEAAAARHTQADVDLEIAVIRSDHETWRFRARLDAAKIALDAAVRGYVQAEALDVTRTPEEHAQVLLAMETISLSRAPTRRGGPNGDD